MKARDIMTAHPAVVTPNVAIEHAATIMRDLDVGMLPVVEDYTSMRLCGVITDRDIAIRYVPRRHGARGSVRSHMTAGPIHTVAADVDIDDAVRLMELARVRRLPVVGHDGRLEGIIATADIARDVGVSRPWTMAEVMERVSTPRAVPLVRC